MRAPITKSFDLPDDDAARARAQAIANNTGREVVVTDELGCELFRVQAIRRNEVAIRIAG